MTSQFAGEEMEPGYGYLSGYKLKGITEQTSILRQLFPGVASRFFLCRREAATAQCRRTSKGGSPSRSGRPSPRPTAKPWRRCSRRSTRRARSRTGAKADWAPTTSSSRPGLQMRSRRWLNSKRITKSASSRRSSVCGIAVARFAGHANVYGSTRSVAAHVQSASCCFRRRGHRVDRVLRATTLGGERPRPRRPWAGSRQDRRHSSRSIPSQGGCFRRSQPYPDRR